MCVRMCPLTAVEAQAVLDARRTPGAHAIRYIGRPNPLLNAHPDSLVPVYVPKDGGFTVARLTWGFPFDGKPVAVSTLASSPRSSSSGAAVGACEPRLSRRTTASCQCVPSTRVTPPRRS